MGEKKNIYQREPELAAAVEAILFTMGESVELSKISAAIEKSEKDTRTIIESLMKKYDAPDCRLWSLRMPIRCAPKALPMII